MAHVDTRCAFARFENLDDVSDPADIKVSWLPTDREGLDVPNKMYPQISTCQEPSTVLLPDGRLLMVMRTLTGHPYYSVSKDDGASWRDPEPLLYRDGGETVNHPISPCPLFKLADGRFLAAVSQQRRHGGLAQPMDEDVEDERGQPHPPGPTFIALGEFRPRARQPIWFSPPEQILDTDGVIVGPKKTAEVGTYPSLTEWQGRRTLWYPDRKYFLLGRYLPDELLGKMEGAGGIDGVLLNALIALCVAPVPARCRSSSGRRPLSIPRWDRRPGSMPSAMSAGAVGVTFGRYAGGAGGEVEVEHAAGEAIVAGDGHEHGRGEVALEVGDAWIDVVRFDWIGEIGRVYQQGEIGAAGSVGRRRR